MYIQTLFLYVHIYMRRRIHFLYIHTCVHTYMRTSIHTLLQTYMGAYKHTKPFRLVWLKHINDFQADYHMLPHDTACWHIAIICYHMLSYVYVYQILPYVTMYMLLYMLLSDNICYHQLKRQLLTKAKVVYIFYHHIGSKLCLFKRLFRSALWLAAVGLSSLSLV